MPHRAGFGEPPNVILSAIKRKSSNIMKLSMAVALDSVQWR